MKGQQDKYLCLKIWRKNPAYGWHLSTDADSSTDNTVGWTKNKQNQKKIKNRRKKIQKGKTQKRLEQYTLQPDVPNPSGSVVSTMFCKEKSAKKNFFYAAILDNFPTKMFNSETTSLQNFSPRIPNLKFFWTSEPGELGAK